MKKIFIALVVYMVFVAAKASTHQTQYYFSPLNTKTGLSNNCVLSIIQDHNGFMWFGTKDGLNRYDGTSFKIFRHEFGNKDALGNSFITCLHEDAAGNIWIGTDVGVYIYSPVEEKFSSFPLKDKAGNTIEKFVTQIQEDKDGRIWINVNTFGLFYYEPKRNHLEHIAFGDHYSSDIRCFTIDKNGVIWFTFRGDSLFYSQDQFKTIKPFSNYSGEQILPHYIINSIYSSDHNKLYIGFENNGIIAINLVTLSAKKIKLSDDPKESIYIRTILSRSDDELWIGTEKGIYIYHVKTDECIQLKSSSLDPLSIGDNAIYALFKDSEEGMWVGSYFGGVNYLPKQYNHFSKFYYLDGEKKLGGRRVREISRSNDGTLWVGTEDAGLYNFDPTTKTFERYAPSKNFSNIHALLINGGQLWVGTFSNGLKVVDLNTKKIVKSYKKDGKPYSLIDNYVFAICKTSFGRIYIGTGSGLSYYDEKKDGFIYIPQVSGGGLIYDIKEDTNGNLWVATYSNGVYRYDFRKDTWKHFLHNEQDNYSLPSNNVLSIFEDSKNQIWLTTQGAGFCMYEGKSDRFISYNSSNGIPNDVIYQVVEDQKGLFWISTNGGLLNFNPATKKVIKLYTTGNGLLNNQFNYKSSCKTSEGDIYFGSIDGLISFNPNTFSENQHVPPIFITDFRIFNKEMKVGEKGSPLKKSILFSDSLVLQYAQHSFSLKIAVLNYQESENNPIVYKLEGFDKNWISYSPHSPIISYANLNYGTYQFKIKRINGAAPASNNEAYLHIEIRPPFYYTLWAYLLYTALFTYTIAALFIYLKKRSRKKQADYFRELEKAKEKELYHSKISFFTDIAHEIRTPLTLIKGPLDSILLKTEIDNGILDDLQIMKQNTSRLLDLTNQLLDFRKAEKEGFRLNFSAYTISALLMETFHRFSSLAKQEHKAVSIAIDSENFQAYVDKEAFLKILSNLYENAIKYSASNIHISLLSKTPSDDNFFEVHIRNDGPIIPVDMREKIFTPFFRYIPDKESKFSGTGIGLALSKSLAELHHGQLTVNEVSDNNVFTLKLPIFQDHAITIETNSFKEHIIHDDTKYGENRDNLYTILIVEDNQEMCHFIKKQLSGDYNVLTAGNGEEGLDKLENHYVHLILCDIMMPHMDGFEFCQIIKTDVNFSHIPIVLLTAKTNIQSKIEGMDIGADAYIEKPFSTAYLIAVIANLINTREKLRDTFAKVPLVLANSMAATKTDKEFLEKLQKIIHENLHKQDLKMEHIAEQMNMIRASFYRKIKGILDLSPNDYLRLERLKAAAQLLKSNTYQINEISYMVGFGTSSYFSKCFHKQFGMYPKEFAGSNNEQNNKRTPHH